MQSPLRAVQMKRSYKMTKKEAKESLLSALRVQGIEYSDIGDIVEFEGLLVRFDGAYVVIRYGKGRVYYPLATLSHINIMERALCVSTAEDYNFSVVYF